MRGATYLHHAAIALNLARNAREATSKLAETLRRLKEIAGVTVRDHTYHQTPDTVLYDLKAYAEALGTGKTPIDLSTSNIQSISITCHNGENVRGATYLRNAAIALNLARNTKEANSKQAETLRRLKEIACL